MPRSAVTNRVRSRDFVSSLLFNGTTDTVVIPHNANQLLTTGLTLSAWIKPRSIGENSQGMIFNKTNGTNSADGFYFTLQTNERINFRVNASSSINSAVGGVPFNRWTHVSVTAAADGTANFYVNGALSGTANQATTALSGITTTNALTIGNRSTATDRTFDGWIDEPIVWNRVLTAQEISDLYLLGDIPTSGLVAGYLFNEGAGTTVNDFSPTANNGTITGATFSADVPMKARKLINGNLVKNGDFEYAPPFTAATTTSSRWIDGTAAGSTTNDLFRYFLVIGASVTGSAQFDTTTKRSGNASLKIVCSVANAGSSVGMYVGATAQSGPSIANQVAYMIPVTPNTTYRFTGYIKTDTLVSNDATGAKFQLTEYTGASTSNSGTNSSSYVTGTTDWTLQTITFTTSSTSRWINIQHYIIGDSTGTAWFDDEVLVPVYPEGRVPANGNLVKNFDFEVAPSGGIATTTQSRWIDGTAGGSTTNSTYKWKCQSGFNATAALFDPTVSHGGAYSLKLSATDTAGSFYVDIGTGIAASQAVETLKSFGIPVVGGSSYTLTGWVKTNNVPTNGAFLQLTTYDTAGTRINNVGSTVKLTGTNDWTQITITQTIGASAAWATIGLMKNVAGNISDAWFDDLFFGLTTNPGRVAIT